MCGGGGGPSHRCEPWPRCDEGAFWTRDSKLAAATVGPFEKKCDPWPECLKDGSRGQSSPLTRCRGEFQGVAAARSLMP